MRVQRWFLVFVALFFGAGASVVLLSNLASSDVKTSRENDMSDEQLARGCGGVCDFPKTKEERKKVLSELQYQVTQEDGTERAFANEYWNNKAAGIYVDVISGEPLFSSTHKFDSGTGWPSFYKPLVSENIVEKEDRKFFMNRTEVRSLRADSHLGHVFPDGPKPTGLRYCINSAALRFVPVEKLEEEGYREYLALFWEESETKNAEVGSSESEAD